MPRCILILYSFGHSAAQVGKPVILLLCFFFLLRCVKINQHQYIFLTFHEREDFLGCSLQPVSQPVSPAQWISVRAGHGRRMTTFQKDSFIYSLSQFASQCIGKRKEEEKRSILQWRVSQNSGLLSDLHMKGDIFT